MKKVSMKMKQMQQNKISLKRYLEHSTNRQRLHLI